MTKQYVPTLFTYGVSLIPYGWEGIEELCFLWEGIQAKYHNLRRNFK